MASRQPSIIVVTFRIAASSILLPLALVAGLLASPVSCQCGSPLPHDHSLFTLGNHAHAPDVQRHGDHVHATPQDDEPDTQPRNAVEVRQDGPSLRVASDFASGQTRAIALMFSRFENEPIIAAISDVMEHPPHRHDVLPESPPPRA